MCISLGRHVPACRNFPIPRDSDQIGDTRSGIAGTSPLSGFQGKATDAQAVDLNSGLLQGENTELDSGKGRWSGANRLRPPKQTYITKNLAFYNAPIFSHSYLQFAALELKKLYISYLLPVTLPITVQLMQSFSWEKGAGIHAFIYEFSVFYFSMTVLLSSFWCLSFLP